MNASPNAFEILVAKVAAFRRADLASGSSALSLLPENAHSLGRLEVLGAVAVTSGGGDRAMSEADWRALVDDPLLDELRLDESPFSNPFVEEIPFFGGPRRVLAGPSGDQGYQARLVLAAMFRPPAIGDAKQAALTKAIALAGLRLSGAMVGGAKLSRRTAVPKGPSEVTVPDAAAFANLIAAVRFDEQRLRQVIGGLDPAILVPITREPIDAPREIDDDFVARLRQWPLLHREGEFVVVLPHALLGALIRALVDYLVRTGAGQEFASRYHRAIVASVADVLDRRLGADLLPIEVPSDGLLTSKVFALDDDCALHVLIATDDLAGYGRGLTQWQPHLSDVIDERTLEVERALFAGEDHPQEILHLIVVEPAGRDVVVGFGGPPPPTFSYRLVAFASELDVFAGLERVDRHTLRQFAVASAAVRTRATVMAQCFLDEFHLYRAHRDSYYLSDERSYNLIGIEPGGADALRAESHSRHDPHALTDWEGAVVSVRSLNADPAIPLYMALDRPYRLAVERLPLLVWIDFGTPAAPEYGSFSISTGHTLGYWMWQLGPSLDPLLTALARRRDMMRIALTVVPGPGWRGLEPGSTGDGYSVRVDAHGLKFAIDDASVRLLHRGDNAADRAIVHKLLEGLVRFGQGHGVDPAVLPDIDEAIARHAPLGQKKHLLLHPQNNPQHYPGDLPPMRPVQRAHEAFAMDRAGSAVAQAGWSVGPLGDGDRTKVLNVAVEELMRYIGATVSSMAPDGLLEALVIRVERLIYERAHSRIAIPTRLACYGEQAELTTRVQAASQDSAAASVATRFLIEYVVARPPRGLRPVSTLVLDDLVAHAALLVNLGKRSDVLHHHLGTVPLALLPSGRIGFKDDTYTAGTMRYVGDVTEADMERAVRDLAGTWGGGDGADESTFLTRFDPAVQIELGFTLTEILIFCAELANAAARRDGEAHSEEVGALVAELAREIPWPPDRVRAAMDLLSLGPRDPFVPPAPDSWQAYPWRYNRKLAYLRRPLLRREIGGLIEIVWGARHVLDAGYVLVQDLDDGRYQAKTPDLAALIGAIREEAGFAFAEKVGDQLRGADRIVKTHVEKFGKVVPARSRGQQLGDFDVLIAVLSTRRLRAIEAKNLALARTPVEEERLLREIFVGTAGKPSDAARHSERCQWLADNLRLALPLFGIDPAEVDLWTVEGLFALNEASSAPYIAESLLPVYSLRELRLHPDAPGTAFLPSSVVKG